ncbi:Auxin-responsive protein SAUR36 [Glycine soja]
MHSSTANKGHLLVYIPLKCLSTNVFRELLNWYEEEFGLPSNGPITLPCDSVLLDYVILLFRERVPERVEKALITSMIACHHEVSSSSSSLSLRQSNEPMIIYGF